MKEESNNFYPRKDGCGKMGRKERNLNLITIDIQVLVAIVKDLSREGISRITGVIISKHQNDVTIRNAQSTKSEIIKD